MSREQEDAQDGTDRAAERPETATGAGKAESVEAGDARADEVRAEDALAEEQEADVEKTSAESPSDTGPDAEPNTEPETGPDAQPGTEPGPEPDGEPGTGPDPVPASGWRRVAQLLRPRGTRSELLTGLLCLALGFALAVQVGQSTGDQLSSLRQDELVRLLDEVTQRAEQLDAEVADLEEIRDDLQSEDGRDQAARDLAQQRAEQEGILSGRLPAQGPGVQIHVADGGKPLEAQALFNLLEELRNAGAEAIQVNGVRLVTTSYFVDSGGGVVLDGAAIASPYEWTAIGDPETIDRALEIPGGALPRIREEGGDATTTVADEVTVDAVRIPGRPEHAEPTDGE